MKFLPHGPQTWKYNYVWLSYSTELFHQLTLSINTVQWNQMLRLILHLHGLVEFLCMYLNKNTSQTINAYVFKKVSLRSIDPDQMVHSLQNALSDQAPLFEKGTSETKNWKSKLTLETHDVEVMLYHRWASVMILHQHWCHISSRLCVGRKLHIPKTENGPVWNVWQKGPISINGYIQSKQMQPLEMNKLLSYNQKM